MIRYLLACIFAVVCLGCQAQYASPVNVAVEVFQGCIRGNLIREEAYPKTKAEIDPYLEDLNLTCIHWTIAWTPALLSRKEYVMTRDEIERFDQRRAVVMQDLEGELEAFVALQKKT